MITNIFGAILAHTARLMLFSPAIDRLPRTPSAVWPIAGVYVLTTIAKYGFTTTALTGIVIVLGITAFVARRPNVAAIVLLGGVGGNIIAAAWASTVLAAQLDTSTATIGQNIAGAWEVAAVLYAFLRHQRTTKEDV